METNETLKQSLMSVAEAEVEQLVLNLQAVKEGD